MELTEADEQEIYEAVVAELDLEAERDRRLAEALEELRERYGL